VLLPINDPIKACRRLAIEEELEDSFIMLLLD